MLGDYFNLNARPVDWSAPQKKQSEDDRFSQRQRPTENHIPPYASEHPDEVGYDPYNHHLDRDIIKKHSSR